MEEDVVMNQTASLGSHITDSPLFIGGVIILVLVIALFLRRMLFHNTLNEYKYNPED